MPDSSYPNTRAVRAACDRLGIPYAVHDAYGNFVEVRLDPVRFFVNASAPCNDGAVEKICKDKEFCAKLLGEAVRMPRTQGYFDPFPQDPQYAGYVREKSYEEITDAIARDFALPVIVKMNAGMQGKHVYLCEDRAAVLAAVAAVFDHAQPSSDYVVLAQEYVRPAKEYRAVVFRGEVALLYEKDASSAGFEGNLSPLHRPGAHAAHVTDAAVIARVQAAVAPVFPKLPLEWGGIDLIEDETGALWVLELNTHPGFHYFVRDNGDAPLVDMYARILEALRGEREERTA